MSAAAEIAKTPCDLCAMRPPYLTSRRQLIYISCYRYQPALDEPTGGGAMLLRSTDPFRDFDRLTHQLLGSTNRPAVMPMDAWREGDTFVIELDVPGVHRESVDIDVERNMLTARAETV